MKNYPYFLEPKQHRLDISQKFSALPILILAAIVLLINEFIFRPHLEYFKSTASHFFSFFVLTLNGEVPLDQGNKIIFLFAAIVFVFLVTYSLLPKWGRTARSAAMKKGLPSEDDHGSAVFYIETPLQKFAFTFWYHYLIRISIFFQIFYPCMLIHLFRTML